MIYNKNQQSCDCAPGCCQEINKNEKRKDIIIDFLFLDLSVCTRCQGTDASLEESITEVAKVLETTGRQVVVNKIHINSKELAIKHRFVTSPTIRINGKDIQLDVKESLCESCGDLCGDEVDCRVWVHEGKEYGVPPKAMITEAILKEVYSNAGTPANEHQYELPENLRKFFAAMNKENSCSCKEGCY